MVTQCFPLLGADDMVYAVAQGAVAVGGFLGGEGGAGGATVQKNHPTVGMVSGGALVEREIATEIVTDRAVQLLLLNPDFASAARIAEAINEVFPKSALAKNASTVNICVPDAYDGYEVNFIASLGAIESSQIHEPDDDDVDDCKIEENLKMHASKVYRTRCQIQIETSEQCNI